MHTRLATAVIVSAALLGGCATKDYVNEQISGVNKRLDGHQAETQDRFSQTSSFFEGLENRVNSQQTALDGTSRTAQEALARAEAAGKLAAGKFLYEVSLSSEFANFRSDSSELSPEMTQALDAFADQVKSANRNVFIEIQGHTDSMGASAANLRLGQARAEAVRRYLAIQGGIALHRMNVISYGESAPVADNRQREGRAENRRVTLVVLE